MFWRNERLLIISFGANNKKNEKNVKQTIVLAMMKYLECLLLGILVAKSRYFESQFRKTAIMPIVKKTNAIPTRIEIIGKKGSNVMLTNPPIRMNNNIKIENTEATARKTFLLER